jgi:hypothetical protein
LQDEYASTSKRFTDWIDWRESVSREVSEAARERKMRALYEIRAVKLLEDYKSSAVPPPAQIPCEPSTMAPAKMAPAIQRDDEIRGQTWAIIGICGDAVYERQRHAVLEGLGREYVEKLREATKLESSDLDCLEAQGVTVDLEFVAPYKASIEALSPEPLVAFFEASDDPEALTKRADIIASSPEMRHADVAVVRLYEWIRLDRTPQRVSRSNRDARAQEFFQAVRSASS